jgi:hypothetical protein
MNYSKSQMPNKLMNKGQKTVGFAPSSLILTNYFYSVIRRYCGKNSDNT